MAVSANAAGLSSAQVALAIKSASTQDPLSQMAADRASAIKGLEQAQLDVVLASLRAVHQSPFNASLAVLGSDPVQAASLSGVQTSTSAPSVSVTTLHAG